jgi:hypothetical protein
MTVSPTLKLAFAHLRTLVRRDPAAAYDAVCELVELLTAPSDEPYGPAAKLLGLGIGRALDDYARKADDIAEALAEAERQPELPLGVAA